MRRRAVRPSQMVVCPDLEQVIRLELPENHKIGQFGQNHRWCVEGNLFNVYGEAWAWPLLARVSSPAKNTAVTKRRRHTQNTSRDSPLERLPLEILLMITGDEHITQQDIFALGLASPLLWRPILQEIFRRCSAASGPWAGQAIACYSSHSGTEPLPRGFRNLPISWRLPCGYRTFYNREERQQPNGRITAAAYCLFPSDAPQLFPQEALKYRDLAAVHLQTPHVKYKKGVQRGSKARTVPAKSPEQCTLFNAIYAFAVTAAEQAWTQPWVLRNLTKKLYVQLDATSGKADSESTLNRMQSVAKLSKKKLKIKTVDGAKIHLNTPQLQLKHDMPGCTCSVSAEDVLYYHTLWGPSKHLAGLQPGHQTDTEKSADKESQRPPRFGDWAGDAFDIVALDRHEGRNSGDWEDITDALIAKFAAIVGCRNGKPVLPSWKPKPFA